MNLRWNTEQRRFEAELHDFASEYPLAKKAKFKYDGAAKVWYSFKSEPLTTLRAIKGTVNLTITPEARAEYAKLHEVELRNAEVKKQMKAAAKELKKKLEGDAADAAKPGEYFDEGLQCYCLVVPPKPPLKVESLAKISPPPEEKCVLCNEPMYEYEYNPNKIKACLWCQKIVLDYEESA